MVHDLPGVGENLRDHPQTWVTWRKADDFEQPDDIPGIQMTLRYTAEGSHLPNDMLDTPRLAGLRRPPTLRPQLHGGARNPDGRVPRPCGGGGKPEAP